MSKSVDFIDEPVEQTNTAYYLCDDHSLVVHFHADKANIFWLQKNYLLTHAVSASGVFYLGEGLTFWIQGENAGLELSNGTQIKCQLSRMES